MILQSIDLKHLHDRPVKNRSNRPAPLEHGLLAYLGPNTSSVEVRAGGGLVCAEAGRECRFFAVQ